MPVIGGTEVLVPLTNGTFANRTIVRSFAGVPSLSNNGPQVDLGDSSRADAVVPVDINGNATQS